MIMNGIFQWADPINGRPGLAIMNTNITTRALGMLCGQDRDRSDGAMMTERVEQAFQALIQPLMH